MNRNPSFYAPGRPQVLLFNFRPDRRSMRIIRYLTETGVAVRQVPPEAYGKPLGALLGMPGYEAGAHASPGAVFREELLVMCGFDQPRLDAFLRFFRDEQIMRVDLKAVLTPTNASWDAGRLRAHLIAERDAMKSRMKQP